jgi:hypothetical protein
VDPDELLKCSKLVQDGLAEAVAGAREDRAEEPDAGDTFVRLIRAALTSKRAYLTDLDGNQPANPAACGWKVELKWMGNDQGQVPFWVTGPNAEHAGWTDGEFVYLEPTLAYTAARRVAEQQGEAFPVSAQTLWKTLDEGQRLALKDPRNEREGRGRLTYRKRVGGKQRNVIVLRCADLWPDGPEGDEAGPPPAATDERQSGLAFGEPG